MTHEQARAAVDGVLETALLESSAGNEVRADFSLARQPDARFSGPAVTVYYDRSIGLAGVAVNALRGPQVTLDGMALVGQVPRPAWRIGSPTTSRHTARNCGTRSARTPAPSSSAWCFGSSAPAISC